MMIFPVLLSLAAATGLGQVSNSAPVGRMLVHADIAPVIGLPGDTIRARLFFSTDSQRTWTERPMVRLAEPGYDSTWQAEVTVPAGPGLFWYYVNADDRMGFATQSPVNAANTWPVTDNLLARVALDPVGDAVSPDGPWLDLTGARVGRSGDRFYVELTNNHSSWPTSGGLFKWYAYSFGFSNPEAPSDSWVFAPVYVSAWPVMETGLFAINRYTGATPERHQLLPGTPVNRPRRRRIIVHTFLADSLDGAIRPIDSHQPYVHICRQRIVIIDDVAQRKCAFCCEHAHKLVHVYIAESAFLHIDGHAVVNDKHISGAVPIPF
ncbi:MAG: hypothetical protein R6X14_08340 [bacterium]